MQNNVNEANVAGVEEMNLKDQGRSEAHGEWHCGGYTSFNLAAQTARPSKVQRS